MFCLSLPTSSRILSTGHSLKFTIVRFRLSSIEPQSQSCKQYGPEYLIYEQKAADTQYVLSYFCTSQANIASQTCNRLRTCFSRFDENEAAIRLRLVPWPLTFQMQKPIPQALFLVAKLLHPHLWKQSCQPAALIRIFHDASSTAYFMMYSTCRPGNRPVKRCPLWFLSITRTPSYNFHGAHFGGVGFCFHSVLYLPSFY